MLTPALLVVFVLSPAQADATSIPFERAARQVLGESAELRVEEIAAALSDSAALERAGPADGIVEMSWNEAQQTAVLHCYMANEQRWVDRTLRFVRADGASDRGRMLGFAAASMFVDAPSFSEARAEAQASQGQASVAPATVAQTSIEVPAAAFGLASPRPRSPAASSSALTDTSSASAAANESGAGARSLDFAGMIASGGDTGGVERGALAAVGIPLEEPLALRIQLAARAGEIPTAQATVQRIIAGVGLAWSVLPESSPIAVQLRADALGSWLRVSHLSDDDVASVQNHAWLFGADAVGTVGYRLSKLLTISAGVGVEALLGQTHVYTHGVERATLPGLRGVGELGLQTRF